MMAAEARGLGDGLEIGRALRCFDQRAGLAHGGREPLLDRGRVRPAALAGTEARALRLCVVAKKRTFSRLGSRAGQPGRQ